MKKNKGLLLSCVVPMALAVSCNEAPKKVVGDNEKYTEELKTLLKSVNTDRVVSKESLNNDKKNYRLNRGAKCLQDETQIDSIVRSTVKSLEQAIEKRNVTQVLSAFNKQVLINSFNSNGMTKKQSFDGIDVLTFSKAKFETLEANNFKIEIQKYLESFKVIDDAKIDVVKFMIDPKRRGDSDLKFNQVRLSAHMDVRGVNKNNKRVQDTSFVDITFSKKNNKWLIDTWNKIQGNRLTLNRAPAFNDITAKSSALSNMDVYVREEAIRRGGYAITSSDYNKDGNPDLIIGSKGQLQAFLGNGDGTYKVNPDAGFKSEEFVKAAILFDYNNDGHQDLGLTKFTFGNYESDLVFYKGTKGGKFEKMPNMVKKVNETDYAMPAAVADFDNDGFSDFYVGFPGEKDFTVLNENNDLARKTPQGMFFNERDGKERNLFKEKPDVLKLSMEDPAYISALFPHSSLAIDYDRDSDMDLIVVDDRNNLSPVYRNEGKRKFTNVAAPIALNNEGYGMGVAGADLNGDGHIDFAITNVNFASASRVNNSCYDYWYVDKFTLDDKGLRVFFNNGDNTFKETTVTSGLAWAGEGMAGVEFVDYNNDGLLDIYVANGLWSGSSDDRDQDLSSTFARAAYINLTQSNELNVENKSSFLNYLKHFRGDLQFKDSSKKEAPSLAGYQRNRLFRNMGNGKFLDVAYLEGVDSIADGYVITTADINADNKVDIVLRNGDPGVSKKQFPVVQVFENNFGLNNSVILTLEGSAINHDAIGSEVVAMIGGKEYVRQLIGNNGAAQSEKMLHFGLGTHAKIDSLKIRWGSGKDTVEMKNIKPGTYHIKQSERKLAKR